jgi:amino acid transporter
MYFYFVLAGFEALMKFVEETREPEKDIPSSFYWSNTISAILTAGVCFAYVITSGHIPIHENDNIISKILGTVLGKGVESGVNILSIILMCITGFIAFLSSTRYLYSISPPNTVLKELNENKVPWATVLISFIVILAGILNNHVYTLVILCDMALTCTLLLVSAAATRLAITKGRVPVIEGATTLGFIGILTMSLLYK